MESLSSSVSSHVSWVLCPCLDQAWSIKDWRCVLKALSARLTARKSAIDSFDEDRESKCVRVKWKRPAFLKSVEAFFRVHLTPTMSNWKVYPAPLGSLGGVNDVALSVSLNEQECSEGSRSGLVPCPLPSSRCMRLLYHGSDSEFVGERAGFSLLQGTLLHEVLQWLRADDCFARSLEDWYATFRSVGVSASVAKRQRVEQENKVEVIGVTQPLSSFMGQRHPAMLPIRIRAFVKAFKDANREALACLGVLMKQALMELSDEDIKENGKHLRDSAPDDWIMVGGSLQLMKPDARCDPVHFDGGASLLRCGLTLFGSRLLHVNQAESKSALLLRNKPGDMYIGCLAACSHFVEHVGEARCQDLLRVDGFGDVEVALMLRCGTFKHAYSISGRCPPKPLVTFQAAAAIVGKWLRVVSLHLPSLVMCQDAAREIT